MATPIRIVQAGCGGMGKGWIKNIIARDDVELVGLVDITPGAAEKARDEVGGEKGKAAQCGTSLPELLTRLKPEVVVDVTIPEAHKNVTLTALKAGCHVIGEKPMAESMQSAREMVAAAQAAGKLYMVSQSRRYNPLLTAVRQELGKGSIGAVHTVNADFYIGAHFGGFRDQMNSPLLLDMAIHQFDMARAITNADPVAVYAVEYNPPGSWYKGDVSAQCIFEMVAGGQRIIFNFRGSWCSEGLNTSWEAGWRVIGSKGTLLWDGTNAPQVGVVEKATAFMNPGTTWTVEVPTGTKNGIAGSFDEFLTALRTGNPTPQGVCHDNIKSLAMVLAAIESAKRKTRIEVAL